MENTCKNIIEIELGQDTLSSIIYALHCAKYIKEYSEYNFTEKIRVLNRLEYALDKLKEEVKQYEVEEVLNGKSI